MFGYWLGLVMGLCGGLTTAVLFLGCASSFMGGVVLIFMFIMASDIIDGLYFCGGPEAWRDRVCDAQWPGPFLFVVGLIVGALPATVSLFIIASSPTFGGLLWAFAIVSFGLPPTS